MSRDVVRVPLGAKLRRLEKSADNQPKFFDLWITFLTSLSIFGRVKLTFSRPPFSSPGPRVDPRLWETLRSRTCAVGFLKWAI